MRYAYDNWRSVTLLDGRIVRLRLKIRRCQNSACQRYHLPYRPETEGRWALPEHEFGLEVIAQIGAWRYREHRSTPEIHQALHNRQVDISERAVTHLLARYDELLAVSMTNNRRLQQVLRTAGRVILALDGLQPDVGHEVLWVVRDCLSGEILRARSLLSSRAADLAALLSEVQADLPVPVAGLISDGQRSVRQAVAQVWPTVPHQLCQFHYLREAALPVYEADRQAKKELKKRVRGVRPLERRAEGSSAPLAGVIQDYCSAVRSALTDDGRPPLAAPGLQLQDRLSAIQRSLVQASKRGRYRSNS
ncbi:MAG: hypothetical protein KA764_05045 [Anaerolineales bacterium]|nr:hypothetical protein [Anaerolineales bacterium]